MGEGADQMRPYDPENVDHDDAANSAGNSSGYEERANIDSNTVPPAQVRLSSATGPAVEPQELDYTYNSSLDMAETIDNATINAEDTNTYSGPGSSARIEPSVTGSEGSDTLNDNSRVVYRAKPTLPPGTRDVTPANQALHHGPVEAVHSSHDESKNKVEGDAETDETETIRANIEQTRSQMSATIDAIQERLSPHNIVDQAKDAVRDATIGRVENMVSDVRQTAQEAGSGFMDTVRENPIPAALAAVGLGWLFMKSRNRNDSARYNYYNNYDRSGYGQYNTADRYGRAPAGSPNRYSPSGYDYAGGGQQGANVLERTQDKAGDVAQKVGRTVGDTAGQVGSAVGDAAGQVRDALGNVVGTVGDTAGSLVDNVQQRAGDIGSGMQYGAQRAQNQLQRMLYENPLAVGGVALAIGAAIGMLLPETEPEHKLMGEARDTVLEKAQSAAQDTLDKVSRVAERVSDTAQDEARRQNLTS